VQSRATGCKRRGEGVGPYVSTYRHERLPPPQP